jgi:hypothetical protein
VKPIEDLSEATFNRYSFAKVDVDAEPGAEATAVPEAA